MRGPDRIDRLIIIGDAHSDPAYPNDRFDWAGAFIADRRPDVVLSIGDFAGMQSLSDHGKGSAQYEGRRYVRDVEHNRDALRRLHAPIKHSPEWYITLGNHENYIDRYANRAAELQEAIGIRDLGFYDYGWQSVPFLGKLHIGGFVCSHYFAGNNGHAISGVNVAEALIRTQHASVIAGHSHFASYARRTTADDRQLHALNVGCYVAPEHEEGWSRQQQDKWWRGLVELEGVKGGRFEAMTWVSMASLRRSYHIGSALDVEHMARTGEVRTMPHETNRQHSSTSAVDTYLGPPSITNGHVAEVDAVSIGGLDYDDVHDTTCEPHITATAAARIAGVDESTCRKQCRDKGITPAEWLQQRGLR